MERLQNIEVEKRRQARLKNCGKNTNGTSGNPKKLTTNSDKYDVELEQLIQTLVDESDQVLGKEN